MKQERKLVITVSKLELIKKLILLAKIVDMCSCVDEENKSLILSTAVGTKGRNLDFIISLSKEIAHEDSLGWDLIKDKRLDNIELIVK